MFTKKMKDLNKKNMNWYKIHKLSSDEDYDNWADAVDYLEEDNRTFIQLLNDFNIPNRIIDVNGNNILVFDDKNDTYVSTDFNDNYPRYDEAQYWISNLSDMELDMYIPDNEEDNFWNNPVPLYHATKSDRIESIKEHGLLKKNESRGLSNRGMSSAVFTTANMDDLLTGSYGNSIIEIDTLKMKQDGYTPEVSGEQPLDYEKKREALADMLEIEYISDGFSSEGYFEDTVVIFGNIPPKYLIFWPN